MARPFDEGKITVERTDAQIETIEFLKGPYQDALTRAAELVFDLTDTRNEIISLPNTFPRGVEDPIFLIYQKASQLLSVRGSIGSIPRRPETISELLDIINYAAFAVALYLWRKKK